MQVTIHINLDLRVEVFSKGFESTTDSIACELSQKRSYLPIYRYVCVVLAQQDYSSSFYMFTMGC